MQPCLEGIAHDLLTRSQCEPPINAVDLAEALGLEVCFSDNGEAFVLGTTVYVPRKVRLARLHWLIAHELGHWAASAYGEDDASEAIANYLGGALLLPRATLLDQLRAGWDLHRLRSEHPNAPASAIAVRIVQLREASAAIYDQGRLFRRWGGELPGERALAHEALTTECPVRVDDVTGAWPVFDGRYRRVIVLGARCD